MPELMLLVLHESRIPADAAGAVPVTCVDEGPDDPPLTTIVEEEGTKGWLSILLNMDD